MSFDSVFRKAFERLNQPGRTSKNLWLNSFEGFRSHFVKTMIFETSKNSQETSKNTQETSEKTHVYDHFFFVRKIWIYASFFRKCSKFDVRNSMFEIRRSKFDVRNSTFEAARSTCRSPEQLNQSFEVDGRHPRCCPAFGQWTRIASMPSSVSFQMIPKNFSSYRRQMCFYVDRYKPLKHYHY